MAHASNLRVQLEELVNAHQEGSSQTKVSGLSGRLLQILARDQSARTNQFEVQTRFDGLIEKSRILNKDALADALQSRLDNLSSLAYKWTPEVLSLFLELSERPIERTRLRDLELLGTEPASPLLTWADIVADDPLEDETAIWRNINYAVDDSDEGESQLDQLDLSHSGSGTECTQAGTEDVAVDILPIDIDSKSLDELATIEKWQGQADENAEDPGFHVWSEYRLAREIIFMLLGLPSVVFHSDLDGRISTDPVIWARFTSSKALMHLMEVFMHLGGDLNQIRRYIKLDETSSTAQTFQFVLTRRLHKAERVLHQLQSDFSSSHGDVVVSLLALEEQIMRKCHLIHPIHIVQTILAASSSSQRPLKILEELYDQVCANQRIGNEESYEDAAQDFFECFLTYLGPLREWMQTGAIPDQKELLFIEKISNQVPLRSIWHGQFRLVEKAPGHVDAPSFLQAYTNQIFNTGKTLHFLQRMNHDTFPMTSQTPFQIPLSFESVCKRVDPDNLSPFPELFAAAFSRWVDSKHRAASILMKTHLSYSHNNLSTSLDALDHIYLFRNTALTTDILQPLFDQLDRGKNPWTDTLTLTELAHASFSQISCIDIDRLQIHATSSPLNAPKAPRSITALSVLQFTYQLPWPVANILRPNTYHTYQAISTLLTQLHRAQHLLARPPRLLRLQSSSSPTTRTSTQPQYYHRLLSLRTQLLNLTSTLLSHLTTLILPLTSTHLRRSLHKEAASDIDAMVAAHAAYVAQVEDACLVSTRHKALHRTLLAILDLVVVFADVCHAASGTTTITPSLQEEDDDSDEDKPTPQTTTTTDPNKNNPTALNQKLIQISTTYAHLFTIFTTGVHSVSRGATTTNKDISTQDMAETWAILAGRLSY